MEKNIQKVCRKHGLTDYTYIKSAKKYKCKKCLYNAINEKRRRNKEELVRYKGGKCEICGYDKCIDALEFHHLNQDEKNFTISNGNIKSLKKLKEEADKCILVCSNCHHELHYLERKNKLDEEKNKEKENEKNYLTICEKYKVKPSKNLKIDLDINLIKEQLKEYSQREIAKMNECSISTLKRFLKENELTNDKEKHKMKYITVNEFIKLFKENGYKKTEVAKILGVKTLALNEFCQRNNIPWHKEKMIEYMKDYSL